MLLLPYLLKGYEHETLKHHRCKSKCACCHTMNCPGIGLEDDWRLCEDCERYFRGDECFQNHQKRGAKGGKSVCQNYCKCPRCQKVINRSIRSLLEHKCERCTVKYVTSMWSLMLIDATCSYLAREKHKMTMMRNRGQSISFLISSAVKKMGFHVPNLVVVKDMYNKETIFRGDDTKMPFADGCFKISMPILFGLLTTSKGMIPISSCSICTTMPSCRMLS